MLKGKESLPQIQVSSHAHGTFFTKQDVLWPIIEGVINESPTNKPKQNTNNKNTGRFIKIRKKERIDKCY